MNGLALYTGYGGLDMGIAIAEPDYRTVCHVEREAAAAANLVARMAAKELHQAPIWDDSGSFDGLPWRGKVHCITAGFPCPAVSVAGKRKGVKDERWLWDDVARITGEVEPEKFLFENVRGLLTANDGHAMRSVLGSLAEMGNDVVWLSVPAKRVGAAHGRDRIFIIGRNRARQLVIANNAGRERRGENDTSAGRQKQAGYAGLGGGELGDTQSDNQWRSGKTGPGTQIPAGRSGGALGNSQNDNWRGELQTQSTGRRRTRPAGTGSDVGDTQGQRQRNAQHNHAAKPWGDTGRDIGRSISKMGDAECCRCNRNERRRAGKESENGRQSLGDAHCQRCGETRACRCRQEPVADWYGGGLPSAPPGPDQDEIWYNLIEQFDTTPQPAIRGMADGDSKRVDRLRMCGNGVYPLAAAYAWVVGNTLLDRKWGLAA